MESCQLIGLYTLESASGTGSFVIGLVSNYFLALGQRSHKILFSARGESSIYDAFYTSSSTLLHLS